MTQTIREQAVEAAARAMCRDPDYCVMGSGGISYHPDGSVTSTSGCYRRAWQDKVADAAAAFDAIISVLMESDYDTLGVGVTEAERNADLPCGISIQAIDNIFTAMLREAMK